MKVVYENRPLTLSTKFGMLPKRQDITGEINPRQNRLQQTGTRIPTTGTRIPTR
jgi:hypothetical protein